MKTTKERMSTFQFIGSPDRVFPNLSTGSHYNITVKEVHEYYFLGIGFGRRFILVTGDVVCPYQSWKSFSKNWKQIKPTVA